MKTNVVKPKSSLRNNMKYNFDKLSERRHTHSEKWNVKENELPMWVADMDFVVMPEIQEAVKKAATNGSYGYSYPTEEFFKAYQNWWKLRHDIDLDTKSMIYVTGVVSALDSLVRTLTNEQDNVMILSPVYNNFFTVVTSNNRNLIVSDLIYQSDNFYIDYQDVEEKIKKHNVKLFIFCNPHNPVGKIWSKEDIEKLYNILAKYNVQMISDEIHCDIVDPGYKYVPAMSISKDIITCIAPSKVFNLAGLHSALTVVNNPELKNKVEAAFYHDDIGEANYFAVPAVIAAYTYGAEYVDELNQYLLINKEYVKNYLEDNLPHVKYVSGHATYLLWLDISYYGLPSDVFAKQLREQTGLFINDGLHYGKNGGAFVRINVATSLENVKDGMSRLSQFLKGK